MANSTEAILLALAEAATPAGRVLAAPDQKLIPRVRRIVEQNLGKSSWGAYNQALRAFDLACLPLTGRRFTRLSFDARVAVLRRISRGNAASLLRIVTAPLKAARAEDPALTKALGLKPRGLVAAAERSRSEERATDARSFDADEELEAEAVVVGTGAGGAAVAHALAARGHAVVILEEGGFHKREEFTGEPFAMQKLLYRNGGVSGALGNTFIPIPQGRTVGGTTTINSGTCYRVPDTVQNRWELEDGLRDLRPGCLDEHYDKVETMIGVGPAQEAHLGGCARVIARGCDVLGYEHQPLQRNAPGCDGQGVCCFGCPTDAKRSTNVSYIPAALERGAMLLYNARVERVLTEQGRATGVVAVAERRDGRQIRITVRAPAVVLACGTLQTPALLLSNGLANSSGRVGKGLTVHPANYSWALFDEQIRGWDAIPQGYAVEEFAFQGIRFEGGFLPPSFAATSMEQIGPRWTELVENLDRMACFGFMLADSSRGQVRLGPGGEPLVSYHMNDEDIARAVRAHGILARIYLAAGATRVFPNLRLYEELRSLADVERMEREGPSRLRARHFDMSAFHPLGTCRMGADPKSSVVGPDHQTHDVEGLFICDGSVVPGPLGVNPQLTIMAFSERAAAFVEARIEQADREAEQVPVAMPLAEKPARLEFAETMSGTCELRPPGSAADGPSGEIRSLVFRVSASLAPVLERQLRERGGTARLEGELLLEGIASHVPCEGTLRVRPLETEGTIVYDLTFTGDDGSEYTLHGEKHVTPTHLLSGMTTLHTEVRRDGKVYAEGILRFELGDIGSFLRSFRWQESA